MGIENIKTMSQLDQCLKQAEDEGDAAIVTSSWGSRDFTLVDPQTNEKFLVKMKEIVTLFDTLSKSDNSLTGEVHDRICGLDVRGDKKLDQEWFGATALRNLRNIADASHLKKLDKIENKIFTPLAKEIGNDIINKLKNAEKNPNLPRSIIKDVFNESNDTSTNKTSSALHYIVQKDPKTALKLFRLLQDELVELNKYSCNPKEFIQSFQEFLNLMKMDINARPEFRDQIIDNSKEIFSPEIVSSIEDLFEKLEIVCEGYSIIFNAETELPEIEFKFTDKEKKNSAAMVIRKEIEAVSLDSLYLPPNEKNIFHFRSQNDETTLPLTNEAAMFFLNVDKTRFNEVMYQKVWDQNDGSEERSKKLKTIVSNLTASEIENFLDKNDISLGSDYFAKRDGLYSTLNALHPELVRKLEIKQAPQIAKAQEKRELIHEVKNFSMNKRDASHWVIKDIKDPFNAQKNKVMSQVEMLFYFEDKYKDIPIGEKLLLFIEHANSTAMGLLLDSVQYQKNIQLDDPIIINDQESATPLAIAMKAGKKDNFESIYASGARECVIQEGTKETRYSAEDYLKKGEMKKI